VKIRSHHLPTHPPQARRPLDKEVILTKVVQFLTRQFSAPLWLWLIVAILTSYRIPGNVGQLIQLILVVLVAVAVREVPASERGV
jgi:hypothetical protein